MTKASKIQLERNVKSLIAWGTAALAMVCVGAIGVLNIFGNLPVRFSPDFLNPGSLWKILVSLYILSWTAGTIFDNRYQIDVVTPSAESRLPLPSILVAAGIFIFLAAIWWFNIAVDWTQDHVWSHPLVARYLGSYDNLILLLTVFWLFNIFAWRYYLVRHIRGLIDQTKTELQTATDGFKMEALDQVDQYISGRWQWVRFIVGAVILIGIYVLAVTYGRIEFSRLISMAVALNIDVAQLALALPHLLTLIWFAGSEAVMWFMRVRLKFYIDCIRDLEQKYSIKPI